MDLFRVISELEGVGVVRNLYAKTAAQPLDLIFFTCPQMRGSRFRSRIRVNDAGTGLTASYKKGMSADSYTRTQRAKELAQTLAEVGIPIGNLVNVFGSADALILFAIPANPPKTPRVQGVKSVSNFPTVQQHFALWGELYRKQPWLNCPRWAQEMERERLLGLLPRTIPRNLAEDFVQRVFAGFALDGKLIREGEFGTKNPVILGVESPGIAILQNAALPRDNWLPVIQLRNQ